MIYATKAERQLLKKMKENEQLVLKELFKNHQINLVEDFERFDLIDDTKKYVIELKIRKFPRWIFEHPELSYQSNPIIEKDKFNSNIDKANELGYKFIYVYAFTNDYNEIEGYNAYDLTMVNNEVLFEKVLQAPKTSFENEKEMINKDCFIIQDNKLNSNQIFKKDLKNNIKINAYAK